MKGVVIENSLNDASILQKLNIQKSWEDGSWKLHEVSVSKDEAKSIARHFADGPWYVHFWEPGSDDVLVVFKNKTFEIKFSDKSTWAEAVTYGTSIGIPPEQLDFPVD